ncbi:AMP-dependent synthetase/ligase [Aestuariimicrobium ganziense]|uniref:AMP-dependent synthetase/ligase n=1 Tax=Aestuariimicrobium ganziense TaxID=2773677 RepID=UPI002E2B0221|nr:long-chain fatty acid--CoA ligase [Aestuariimicrobium ganziense]
MAQGNELAVREEIRAKASKNIGTLLRERVQATPEHAAFLVPDRKPEGPNEWAEISWRRAEQIVHEYAAGLLSLGLEPEGRVAIASTTRIEWVYADLAIACAGGATTTIYPNTQVGDVVHILSDSDSTIVIAENADQVAKIAGQDALDDVVRTIVLVEDDAATREGDSRVITLDELAERGRQQLADDPELVNRTIDGIDPDALSTLIYTSGTTGLPKGVELTHRTWTYEAEAIESLHLIPDHTWVHYLWLPLSHVFGKCLLSVGVRIGFTTAVDGRIDRIVQGLGEVRPHFMCGAPRIYEKVRAAVLTKSREGTVADRIARWAFHVGRRSRTYRLEGRPLPKSLAVQYKVADKLVFSKLKARMGGRIQFFVSGAAKLSEQVQAWFYSAGITVVEGYGLTETAAIACVNAPQTPRFGTVGPATPGVELKIADDGEVLFRGPIVMRGYRNMPEATEESIVDGWFHTGDIGELDSEGYLRITDRKKDLMKTSGGKYVAPQKVEGAITANIPYVSQAVCVGDGKKYISALVTLDPVHLQTWADRRGRGDLSYAELTQLPEIKASIARFMERANHQLERWETVKQFAILDHELSVDEGGVTPNMKIRRKAVQDRYADIIAGLYDDEDSVEL